MVIQYGDQKSSEIHLKKKVLGPWLLYKGSDLFWSGAPLRSKPPSPAITFVVLSRSCCRRSSLDMDRRWMRFATLGVTGDPVAMGFSVSSTRPSVGAGSASAGSDSTSGWAKLGEAGATVGGKLSIRISWLSVSIGPNASTGACGPCGTCGTCGALSHGVLSNSNSSHKSFSTSNSASTTSSTEIPGELPASQLEKESTDRSAWRRLESSLCLNWEQEPMASNIFGRYYRTPNAVDTLMISCDHPNVIPMCVSKRFYCVIIYSIMTMLDLTWDIMGCTTLESPQQGLH